MKLSLKTKVLLWSMVMGVVTIVTGIFAIQATRRIDRSYRANFAENVSGLKAAEELEIALLDQKGYVSSYLLDGDSKWLLKLEEKRQNFQHWLGRARDVGFTAQEQAILDRISLLYEDYDGLRMQVIALAQQGNLLEAQQLLLHSGARHMEQLYGLCEELLFVNEQLIAASQRENEHVLAWLQWVVWGSIAIAIILGVLGGLLVARALTKRIVQSEKLATLGQMAGLVAHEVRNPLTAITMRVHSLEEEMRGSASAQDDLTVIGTEIERLKRIVQNFLNLARLPEPHLSLVKLRTPIERALGVLRPAMQQHGIQLTAEFGDGDAHVRADEDQLQQVFLNLFLNALQVMPQGGRLGVTTQPLAPSTRGAGQIQVLIEDSGPGISTQVRRRLFDPFFTTKADGIGLGLSLAKRIIELHRGSIELQPAHPTGTRVCIRLPLVLLEKPA